jgi:signal recognition particle subunit SRP19
MRKQNRLFFFWPVYFDAKKSRADGRRVPKRLAVPSPKLEDLQLAAKRLGLQPEIIYDASHPRTPWRRTGLLIVPKKESKGKTMKIIAEELSNLRR